MQESDYKSLFGHVRNVAQNIRSLAQSVDEGKAPAIDSDDYEQNYSYFTLIMKLSEAGLAHASDYRRPPSEELRRMVDPVLSALHTNISTLYEDARKGATFIAKSSWKELTASHFMPTDFSPAYKNLLETLDFIGVQPGSREMCTLLGTDEKNFRRIEKAHALVAIYYHLNTRPGYMRNITGLLAPAPIGIMEFTKPQSLESRLEASFSLASNPIGMDLRKMMEPYGLTFTEVATYVVTRLEMDNLLPEDERRHEFVH